MSSNSSPKRAVISNQSFPARILALSLLLTAFTLGWLGYCAVSTYTSVAATSLRYERSADLRGTIVHLDEVLTMSAYMAAETGDPFWERRYRKYETELVRAIQATMRESPPSPEQTRQLREANAELTNLENRTFDAVRADELPRARAILKSLSYSREKELYATSISNYMEGARTRQRQELSLRRGQNTWVLAGAFIGILSLSLSWILTIRELAHWHAVRNIEIGEQRAQLQASEDRFLRIASNVPGMVYRFVLKTDGAIEMPFVSEGAREVYGLDPAAIRADPMAILNAVIAEDRPSVDESIAQSARDNTPWHWDGRVDTPNGTRKWISGSARPERQCNGDVIWDGVLLDITTRKNHEADLEQARHAAENANRVKSEFLSRMSHELRTPLNAILGFGQLLEIEELSATQSESVGQIMTAGHHLLALINEVLDIARIESGQQELQLQPLDAAGLAREVCALVQPLAAQNNVTLDAHPKPGCCGLILGHSERVIADPQRLKQVLLNLLSNAIKYAGEGAIVTISCAQIADGAGAPMMALSVSDNGPGIAPDLQERVWMPFDRLGAESGATEGAGIGLPLARALAQAMDGTLVLHSEGQGCTFTLTLPCAAPGEVEGDIPFGIAHSASNFAPSERETIREIDAHLERGKYALEPLSS